VVQHAKPHSMAWCLECHRQPEKFLRPEDQIFNLDWKPEDVKPTEFVAKYGQPKDAEGDFAQKQKLTQVEIGQTLKERWNIQPPLNCQGCHR
ncbi:MAG: cytochrome C, partial [Chthoniobacterales bacterium]